MYKKYVRKQILIILYNHRNTRKAKEKNILKYDAV